MELQDILKFRLWILSFHYIWGANEENMSKGAAQLTETSMPIGGNNTNMAVVAHRGYSYAKMFREIEKLKIGDEIFITNFWGNDDIKRNDRGGISPDEIDKIRIQEGKDMVGLLTCHPYPHNYQRYLVYCESLNPCPNLKMIV